MSKKKIKITLLFLSLIMLLMLTFLMVQEVSAEEDIYYSDLIYINNHSSSSSNFNYKWKYIGDGYYQLYHDSYNEIPYLLDEFATSFSNNPTVQRFKNIYIVNFGLQGFILDIDSGNDLELLYYDDLFIYNGGILYLTIPYSIIHNYYIYTYDTNYSQGLIDYQDGYDDGRLDGYNDGIIKGYTDGYNDGENIGFQDGYDSGKSDFGIYSNNIWKTAYVWGNERYQQGVQADVNFLSWITPALWMPAQILSIEIAPGLQLGYLALFSLLMGMMAWFFKLVGKGK